MRVHGVEITIEQRRAGIAAMVGEKFTKNDVASAMRAAGVPYFAGEGHQKEHCADRAADRLLQAERKAGRVVAISNRTWKRL